MKGKDQEYSRLRASTFEETARIAGACGAEVDAWLETMERLDIYELKLVSGLQGGEPYSYVDVHFLPVGLFGYGFRYAPSTKSSAQRALRSWQGATGSRLERMDNIGDGWFYYEGWWTESLPFQPRR